MNLKKDHLPECQTLLKHVETFSLAENKLNTINPEYVDLGVTITLLLELFQSIKTLNIYNNNVDTIIQRHNITECEKHNFIQFLEYNAILYVASIPKKHLRKSLSSYIEKLTHLSKHAESLKGQLTNSAHEIEFANFILRTELSKREILKSIPEEYGQDYLKDLDRLLTKLVELPTVLKNSSLGTEFRLGKTGPIGEPENIEWMKRMYGFWTQILGRTFKFSAKSNSGRENFLIFCESCFEPLYPSISTNALRNCLKIMERDHRNADGTISA